MKMRGGWDGLLRGRRGVGPKETQAPRSAAFSPLWMWAGADQAWAPCSGLVSSRQCIFGSCEEGSPNNLGHSKLSINANVIISITVITVT